MDDNEHTLAALRRRSMALPETAHQRRTSERKADMRHDGRSNRTRQPVVTLTVGLPPEIKPRINAICRRNDILIKDFLLEALEMAFAKYDPKE